MRGFLISGTGRGSGGLNLTSRYEHTAPVMELK